MDDAPNEASSGTQDERYQDDEERVSTGLRGREADRHHLIRIMPAKGAP